MVCELLERPVPFLIMLMNVGRGVALICLSLWVFLGCDEESTSDSDTPAAIFQCQRCEGPADGEGGLWLRLIPEGTVIGAVDLELPTLSGRQASLPMIPLPPLKPVAGVLSQLRRDGTIQGLESVIFARASQSFVLHRWSVDEDPSARRFLFRLAPWWPDHRGARRPVSYLLSAEAFGQPPRRYRDRAPTPQGLQLEAPAEGESRQLQGRLILGQLLSYPLAKARVSLERRGERLSAYDETDTSGHFSLNYWPQSDGHPDQLLVEWGDGLIFRQSIDLTREELESETELFLRLETPSRLETLRVSLSYDGAPISFAGSRLFVQSDRAGERLLVADLSPDDQFLLQLPQGRYRFWLFPPESGVFRVLSGEWLIEGPSIAERRDRGMEMDAPVDLGVASQDQGETLPPTARLDFGSARDLGSGESSTSALFVHERSLSPRLAVRVSGEVRNADGQALSAMISAELVSFSWTSEARLPPVTRQSTSDESGAFELTLEPGQYIVTTTLRDQPSVKGVRLLEVPAAERVSLAPWMLSPHMQLQIPTAFRMRPVEGVRGALWCAPRSASQERPWEIASGLSNQEGIIALSVPSQLCSLIPLSLDAIDGVEL